MKKGSQSIFFGHTYCHHPATTSHTSTHTPHPPFALTQSILTHTLSIFIPATAKVPPIYSTWLFLVLLFFLSFLLLFIYYFIHVLYSQFYSSLSFFQYLFHSCSLSYLLDLIVFFFIFILIFLTYFLNHHLLFVIQVLYFQLFSSSHFSLSTDIIISFTSLLFSTFSSSLLAVSFILLPYFILKLLLFLIFSLFYIFSFSWCTFSIIHSRLHPLSKPTSVPFVTHSHSSPMNSSSPALIHSGHLLVIHTVLVQSIYSLLRNQVNASGHSI